MTSDIHLADTIRQSFQEAENPPDILRNTRSSIISIVSFVFFPRSAIRVVRSGGGSSESRPLRTLIKEQETTPA
jgi:hypothetical protein